MIKKYTLLSMLILLVPISVTFGQGLENFNNYPETSGTYASGTFIGQDGSTWTYTQCRGDRPIISPSPCLGKNRTPASVVYSGVIPNGCGTISFDYKQGFSSAVNLNLLINGLVVKNVTSPGGTGDTSVVHNSGPVLVNVSGDIVIRFEQANNTTSGQVTIDNVTWTAYNTGPLPEPTNYPTAFTAVPSSFSISLNWLDATGEQLPSAYLLLASEFDNIELPVDGAPVPDDPNLLDGYASMNIFPGVQSHQFTNLPSNKPYFFKIFPYTNSGTNINYKTDGNPPSATAITPNVAVINSENFNSGTFGLWTRMKVVGDTNWTIDMTHGVGLTPCAKASGFYSGGAHLTEIWLFSPPMNFDQYTNEVLSFQTAWKYAGPALEVLISSDYNGTGNPNEFTWTTLSATLSPGNWVWTPSGDVDVSSLEGTAVYIGFKFTSTDTESSTWEVDDIQILGISSSGPLPEPTNYPSNFTAVPSPFTVNLSWTDATGEQVPTGYLILGSITDNFELPVDGIPVTDDPNLADGYGSLNVAAGVQLCQFANLPVNTPYYFRIFPYTNSGILINYKTDGTPPSATATTPNTVIINSENFSSGTFGTWTEMTVVGDSSWVIDPTHGVDGTPCAKANGRYNSIFYTTEMWLLSPALDFDLYTGTLLSFQTAKNYTGPALETLVSLDYDGTGNPNNFTWTPLTSALSPGGWIWTFSGNLDLSAFPGSNVHIAFKYTSTDTESATWELDDILISGILNLDLPSVTTNPAFTGIAYNSATGGGNVTDDGGSPVLARGLCYSTIQNPTIIDPHTTETGTLGEFTSTMTELSPQTTYFVKAYATTSVGTGYGEEASFSTPCEPIAPVSDFFADTLFVKIGETVHFTDASTLCPSNWEWTFAGGTPETFSGQVPPPVQYNTPGVYQVCLTVTNGYGNSTNCKDAYITVYGPTNAHIVMTEIMYNPPESGTDSLEFIEIYNNDQVAWNLHDFYFDRGIVFTFPDYTMVPGSYLLVSKNSSAFQNTFHLPSVQWTEGALSNAGEPIVIKDYLGFVVDSVYYRPNLPWDTLANGRGPSLELCDPGSDNTDPLNWRHAIEFQAVNAEGDSIWASPAAGCSYFPVADFSASETTITEHGFVTFFDASTTNTTDWQWTFEGGVPSSFSGKFPPSIQYDVPGQYTVCLVASNNIGSSTNCKQAYITVLGPTNANIVITEIMYNPPGNNADSLQFIELYNNDNITWNLNNFSFTRGVTYTLPEAFLDPGDFMIIAKNSAAIQNTFHKPSYQWTDGTLSNAGGPIVLRDNLGFIIDTVYYQSVLPWDTTANGHGPSLELCDPSSDNNDPVNWRHSIIFQAVNADGDSIWASPLAGCSYVPVADFTGEPTTIREHEFVNFTDASSSGTTGWEWTFEGGTPGTFSGQNPPPIQYNNAGAYRVCLLASNAYGGNTKCKNDYITVQGPSNAGIVMTEIMYNPPESGADSLEFIELYNNDVVAWDLQNFYFDQGIGYIFPQTVLNPGAFVIIAKNSAAFQSTFHLPSQQWTEGSLSNEGEPVVLKDHLGFVVDSVYYHPL
ncbi:MAG: lamin tail domain-containing protein, partial [Bacteroidota bacterium]